MAPDVGGTEPGAEHDYAVPFDTVRNLLKKYRDRDAAKLALVDLDQETSITYGQLHEAANRIARRLHAMGVRRGDRVALLSDERLEKLILWVGIWRAGAAVAAPNVEMNIAYISEILRAIEPKLTLWDEDLDVAAMTDGVDGDVVRFSKWRADTAGDAESDEFFAQVAAESATPELDVDYSPDDICSIYCTSGTTAKPKIFANSHMCHWAFGLCSIDQTGVGPDDRTLEYRSFGWSSAQGMSLMSWLITGCTLHFARHFSHSRFAGWIADNGITFSVGVPTVINMLINKPLDETGENFPTLRAMSCSTAPLSPDRWERFEKMYGIKLLQMYGTSEGGWICGNRHDRRRMGTVGPPAKHQEFLIVDENGERCPPGVEGEVTLGGPQCAVAEIGYDGEWHDIRGKRMHLGDLAVMDEDGFVTVTGRLKDLIIRGGVNISPLELDNVLLREIRLLEAAAVGVPDEIYGEEVICYVVPKPGENLTEADVRAHCEASLPEFRRPKEIHFVDEIPKNERGKVKRDALRDRWLEGR
jgi:acyl-coenzyme A synthetase/AMP-(fatty) acid ligase